MAWLAGALGCVGHLDHIRFEDERGSASNPSSQEIDVLTEEISNRLLAVGLVEQPDLAHWREVSEKEDIYDYVVLHKWVRKKPYRGDDVRVILIRKKDSGFVSLYVVNRHGSRSTSQTDEIVHLLIEAAEIVLPGRNVVAEGGPRGVFVP